MSGYRKLAIAYGIVGTVSLFAIATGQQPTQAPPVTNGVQMKPEHVAVVTCKVMCCVKESVPAIKALSSVPGVKRVTVDHKQRSLFIEPREQSPSPQAMWDALVNAKLEPIRLATRSTVYSARPGSAAAH